jgi:hypothetical protein
MSACSAGLRRKVSFYDILLDEFVSKSGGKLHREELDKMITEASAVANTSKWSTLIAFGQMYSAYADFEKSMLILESGRASLTESEFSRLRENILQMAEEEK